MTVIISSAESEVTTGLKHKYLFNGSVEAPLVYLVHGRAGTFDVMWTFRRCLPDGCNIIVPQAELPDSIGGYSWWPVERNAEFGPGAEEASQKLLKFISNAETFYKLTPQRRLAFGFSQGAGLLSVILQRQPGIFSGLAILAGFVVQITGGMGIPPQAPEVIILHGQVDETVPLEQAKRGEEYLRALGLNVTFHADPVGHKVGSTGMRLLKEWTAKQISL